MDKPKEVTPETEVDASAVAVLERFIASLGNDMTLVGQALFGTPTEIATPANAESEKTERHEEHDLSPFIFRAKKRRTKKKK